MLLAYLPSPSQGVWHLGPVPVRAYALCIIAGIFAAVWLTGRRWAARGGHRDDVADIALWAVPFGLLGGRLYHVVTDPELYFTAGKQPLHALYVWDGGLGIPGAVALGAVGAWIGCRRRGVKLADFADALAPGLVLAQAIGRWGNYFNQELFGRPTHLPWALLIDPAHRPADSPGSALYHPTFLYESLWDLGVMALLLVLDRRYRLRRGRLFACYVLAYTAGRAWIEALRIDHANHFLGLRLNDWVSAALFAGALIYLLMTRHPHADGPSGSEPGANSPPDHVPAEGTAPASPAGNQQVEEKR
ncbi:prolipoprotein diacylglyceryl transferase [Streptomyces sp. H10-C2]|uniref:prolipoprotein diacylglyceryl transferase n=1 Tax=unclassified Streptomyces TaxID=2593676 RepID=UPI0024BA9054|nr:MULTISPECIES: prolipoprotein diacylglyceryl transferase [unclassified Streptomyces]MDJ0341740.1 prolipoprotein diacylglyceryl transferase [Streptomyces sp. PH10-H1]MDJ0368952.1 prolipoprotein diacylglyceryl transferase [Streptomyces sp. H10-C2]